MSQLRGDLASLVPRARAARHQLEALEAELGRQLAEIDTLIAGSATQADQRAIDAAEDARKAVREAIVALADAERRAVEVR